MTRRMFRAFPSVVFLVLAASFLTPELAFGTPCASGTLATFLGGNCTIGNALFTVDASFSQGNRNNQNPPLSPQDILRLSERVVAGLRRAKREGKVLGRKRIILARESGRCTPMVSR